jgi:hypothetical protein
MGESKRAISEIQIIFRQKKEFGKLDSIWGSKNIKGRQID